LEDGGRRFPAALRVELDFVVNVEQLKMGIVSGAKWRESRLKK
jgi:hypothetical protein